MKSYNILTAILFPATIFVASFVCIEIKRWEIRGSSYEVTYDLDGCSIEDCRILNNNIVTIQSLTISN